MKFKLTYFTALLFLFITCTSNKTKIYPVDLVIKGGTILDLSSQGKSKIDLKNMAVLIKSDTIFGIIEASDISKNQKNIIDATGKFIIPGLTDGFSVI
ncbi:MAG: hypothetical protein QM495_03090, partial [Lutibacter sp.]